MASTAQRDKFRAWIVDYADSNLLDQTQEFSDDNIDDAFDDALNELNYDIDPPLTVLYTLDDVPYSIIKLGAIKHLLLGQGIQSARNAVDYSDSGGVNVRAFNKWEKYLQWFDRIERKWETSASRFKIRQNIISGWGGVPSEYSEVW